jgi:NADH-quinone oxidoreductase subunit J
VLAFELTSALLITAAVGAMVLAHKERIVPRLTQRQQSEARFSAGGRPSPLPGPGVYATVNSVDTPALLPDGQVAEESVATAVSDMHLTTLPAPEPVGLGGEEAR